MPRLLNQFSPVVSVFILAFLWTFWHFPLHLIPIWIGSEPLHLMLVYTPALAVITTWLTNKADGSVMPAVFLHYATNLYGDYLLSTDVFVEPLNLSFTMIKASIYWLIALILLLQTRGTLDIS
jgi:membrane protease YdiL (CAAX protease family)